MAPKLSDQQAILFIQENPKRSGTKAHERYEGYKAAKTIEEALRLGAVRGDITNDVKAGFCKVQDVEALIEAAAAIVAAAPPLGVLADDVASRKRPAVPAPEACAPPAPKAPKVDSPKPPQPVAPQLLQPAMQAIPPASVVTATVPSPVKVSAEPGPTSTAVSTAVVTAAAVATVAKPLKEEVDLSFAKLEGMPMKYVKRSMGEARRLLSSQGREEARREGYEFQLADRDNLSKWAVKLRDLNPEGHLAKGLAQHKLEASIDLEITLPVGFPLEPPFARVVYPKLHGGYVFTHGGICFEPLTAKGWAPSMTLPSLAIAIKGIMDYGDVKVCGVGDKVARRIPEYSEEGARKDHNMILKAHRDGESTTYGSLKHYAS